MNEVTIAVFIIVALSLIMYATTLFLITVDASPAWILPMIVVLVAVIGWLYLEVMA